MFPSGTRASETLIKNWKPFNWTRKRWQRALSINKSKKKTSKHSCSSQLDSTTVGHTLGQAPLRRPSELRTKVIQLLQRRWRQIHMLSLSFSAAESRELFSWFIPSYPKTGMRLKTGVRSVKPQLMRRGGPCVFIVTPLIHCRCPSLHCSGGVSCDKICASLHLATSGEKQDLFHLRN